MSNLFDKLNKVVDHYNEIEQQMAEPDVLADHTRLTELAQERMDLNELVDINLDEKDLVITAEFSSGPGGQHMQKNATAARVVHKPTGMFVKIPSERSLISCYTNVR